MNMSNQVRIWEEEVTIPTYGIGKPEKNPIFLEKRVYQGSSGSVYPHPVIEKILDEKRDQVYQAVFLENEYLKIMILPELGGRVQMAWDKVRQRHFIYYNRVIKPALVGLTGPWISGGIEFNWPQHHRPSTFERVDYTLRENEDGSKTVWINEVELMFRTKGMACFTLYPGKAYLEITGNLYNRTPFPQTFLWWANPAVKANDHYQSIFPPDVYAVYDHGKRDVSTFPIATGTYYKVNYAPGTDISWYKNIPVPTSFMAVSSHYDFMGGYEHDNEAGLLHVADHHIAPGKKQWTWGHGDFGRAWDRNLTDEDGPYIELMTGVFTDNQPDFSWIQPLEGKTFTQYFMPFSKVGMVKNATKEAMVNLEVQGGSALVKVYATALYPDAVIALYQADALCFEAKADLSPQHVFEETIALQEGYSKELEVKVKDAAGNVLVGYRSEENLSREPLKPAIAAQAPEDITTNEGLYLNGLHLEQYRHAIYAPTDYYQEALRRDPEDARNNNALGLWYLRRGQASKAEPFFRKAIRTLTSRNPNPYDGEPFYNLGLALKLRGRLEDAFEAFYKSTWNAAWQHPAFFELARISCIKKDYSKASAFADQSLVRNWHSHSVRHLKAILLHKVGNTSQALQWIEDSLRLDPFNYGCRFEQYFIFQKQGKTEAAHTAIQALKKLMHGQVHNYIEYALDYAAAGLYEEAEWVLNAYINGREAVYPMVYYYLGYFALHLGQEEKSLLYFKKAAAAQPDYCFPHRVEDVAVLQAAMTANPQDAKAPYYLGNFWYDKRQYAEAVACWERSAELDQHFPTVYRNLSLAYYNKKGWVDESLRCLEKAFLLDTSDARILMELDQLHKKINTPIAQRLAFLEKYPQLVADRDDLYLERITLLNSQGQYVAATELLAGRHFHPWEGGEGKVVGQFLLAHIELAKKSLIKKEFHRALELLQCTEQYPPNLGEGKLYGTAENDIDYLKGCAYEGLGEKDKAQACFNKATVGVSEPVQAIFYNDPQPDKIFYQGLAWLKQGDIARAGAIFNRLIQFGEEHMNDRIGIDYFAVSLPDLLVFDQDLTLKNKLHCLYLIALGNLGLGNYSEAEAFFTQVLDQDVNHQGARVHLSMIDFLKNGVYFR